MSYCSLLPQTGPTAFQNRKVARNLTNTHGLQVNQEARPPWGTEHPNPYQKADSFWTNLALNTRSPQSNVRWGALAPFNSRTILLLLTGVPMPYCMPSAPHPCNPQRGTCQSSCLLLLLEEAKVAPSLNSHMGWLAWWGWIYLVSAFHWLFFIYGLFQNVV